MPAITSYAIFFEIPRNWNVAESLPEPDIPAIQIDCSGRDDEEVLHDIIRQVYDIEIDDRLIREAAIRNEIDRARNFDGLRKNYRVRREFMNTTVDAQNAAVELKRKIRALGFVTNDH